MLRDERIYGATLLDITPTILTVFGLPVGADMDGRVLVQAFEPRPEVRSIPSWEQCRASAACTRRACGWMPNRTKAVIEQFVALGYVQQEEDQQKAVAKAVRELRYNRARALIDERSLRKRW